MKKILSIVVFCCLLTAIIFLVQKEEASKIKQEEVIKCFNESGHALKINFLSAYKTNGFPPSQAMSAAKDINPWINKEIANLQSFNS